MKRQLFNIWAMFKRKCSCGQLMVLFFSLSASISLAQAPPPVSCVINGTDPVTALQTYTYTLAGSCSATSWTTSCGTIQSSTSTSVTIFFNNLICTTATIAAVGTTASKTVTVNPAPLTGGSLNNPTQSINYNTAPALLTATSPSGGRCGSYTYQWYSSPNNITYSSISGANSSTYQPPALISTTYYKRQTVCGTQNAYTSNVATITVYPQLIPGTVYVFDSPGIPTETLTYGQNSGELKIDSVSGGNGTYTYQWQSSPDNINWNPIAGANDTIYTSPPLIATTYFNVAVTSNLVTLNSHSFEAIVNPQLNPGLVTPAFLTITSGTSPGQILANPAFGGGCSGSYTYQWQSSTDGILFTNISGATSVNYTTGTLTVNTWFRRKVTCSSDILYTNYCQVVIGSQTTNLNYMRVRDILKPGVTDTVTADALSNPVDVAQTTQYFDGLGKLVQTVSKESSPLQKDVVEPVVYDNFGRQAVQYLPYIAATNDGNFKSTALADQNIYNAVQFAGEQYYYSEINYEPSPLNKALNSFSPGMSWTGSSIGITSLCLINTAADSVRIWSISSVQLDIPVSSGTYGGGQLIKSLGVDEQGHQVVEYKDKIGKTILKKVQQVSSPSTGHYGWICTYYVYDTLQNLRVIIQPQAVALINGSWTISTNIANELCFRYEYDGRKRLAIKKVPGAGQIWLVYDARNRVVMTQDSALRSAQKWMFTKYDSENRPDSTGLITDPTHYNNLSYHDTLAYYSTNYPTVSSFTNELLTMSFYDDYGWVSTYSAPVASAMATNYTSNGSYFITTYNTSPTYAVAVTPSYIVRGMSTGSMKKVIGTSSQYLYAATFYDDRGRIIQTQSVNYTGGIDTATIQYNFHGAVVRTLLNHKKNGNTVQSHIVLTKMDYDHAFRLKHIYKNIDNASTDQLIDSIQYNEFGQLRAKYMGNNVDSMIYDYNIRGWLTGINKNYIAGTANHFFGMELGYDKTTSVASGNTYLTPQFNGNIEGEVWKSAGAGINRKYDFTYDNANRLAGAAYLQNTTSGTWDKAQIDFSVTGLNYDANGNILAMTQRGFTVGGSSAVDSLAYTYLNSGGSNKLMGVTDAANNPSSLLGDFHYATGTKQSTDYNYDANGNLTHDNNKNIDTITYNYLNLPQLVHMNTKGNIVYTYDAAGDKQKKVITDSTNRHSTTIIYVAGFVYQQTDTITNAGGGTDTLQFIAHEEGRVRWAYHKYTTGTSAYKFEYDFFEKDHLGNTRMLLTQQRDTSNYLASMEAAYRTNEAQLFNNITTTCVARTSAPGYPANTTITNPNDSVSKLDYNGSMGQKAGPSLLLKVMSGDTINMAVQSYYNTNSITTTNSSFNDVLNSLANGLVNMTSGAHGTVGNLTTSGSSVYTGLSSFLTADDPAPPAGYPKAYLNWVFLDDQFNYVSSLSGSVKAASTTYPAATLNAVAPGAPIYLTRSGYLYIWVSNETQGWDVFFDNLSVQHRQGPLLEENHYYPFGLSMAGISDKAIKMNYAENKYRYNQGTELQNKEFSDGSGWEIYETGYRSLDPQLGRFTQIDPLTDKTHFFSAYQYAGNNPISGNDPTGLLRKSPDQQALMDQAMGIGVPNGYGNLDRSIDDISDDANYAASLMGVGGGGGSNVAFWSNVLSALLSGGDGSSYTSNGDGTGTYEFGDVQGSGPGTSFNTGDRLAGDNTDLDQNYHSEANGALQKMENIMGPELNFVLFKSAFEIGGMFETDAETLFNTFVNGQSLGSDQTTLIFGNSSSIGQAILNLPAFQNFATQFQNEYMANMNDPNSTWNGNDRLFNLSPDLTSNVFLHTVMGGYQYLSVNIGFTDAGISFSYNFVDHFGAGIHDSNSDLPGLSNMYYLQHNYGNSNQFTPFMWSASVTTTVPLPH